VLEFARTSRPDFFAALRYRIIEQFPVLQDRQSETLAKFEGKIEWRESIDALELFTGLHFSNELLDAMPVHLIVSEETKTGSTNWLEKFVTLNGDEFAFVDQSIGNQKLRDHLQKLPARPASYETEVNLTSLGWIENVSRKLARGYVIIADYGYLRDEFYAPHRSRGTLQVRAQHRLLSSPFDEIGRADITAHVEWTSIAERAEACGLQVKGFTDQHHFITGILSELPRDDLPGDAKTTRALQTVLHPEMLGRTFQVLALAKDGTAAGTAATTEDVDLAGPFAGFKFAREPRSALDLDHPNPC
jgi:SAM-dependent MidA family methyltransferase